MITAFYSLQEAIEFKEKYIKLIDKVLAPVGTPLLKLIIIQKTPTEFGQISASQRFSFEDEEPEKIISDEEFESQMKVFDNADLSKKQDEFYYIIGIFRYPNGEPLFEPLYSLLVNNAVQVDVHL